MTPSAIVTQVTVATGDPRRPWATGIAFDGPVWTEAGGTLALLGQAAEIQKLAGPDTRIVSAGGATLALPSGTTVGSRVRLTVAADGCVTGLSLVTP